MNPNTRLVLALDLFSDVTYDTLCDGVIPPSSNYAIVYRGDVVRHLKAQVRVLANAICSTAHSNLQAETDTLADILEDMNNLANLDADITHFLFGCNLKA